MAINIHKRSRLRRYLGDVGTEFLEHGLGAITRILPHTEDLNWAIGPYQPTSITWASQARRELELKLGLKVGDGYSVSGTVRRRTIPQGVGHISRTLDMRERDIRARIVERVSRTLSDPGAKGADSLRALRDTFDESVVSDHLTAHHRLEIALPAAFGRLRTLAEQTYETKALTFGCVIDADVNEAPSKGAEFPEAFLTERKKYRALSDGYHTAYVVSSLGAPVGFIELANERTAHHAAYFPEWGRRLASESKGSRIGICLTRHGDLLVFDGGSLRFTYRFGRWQYWNHSHLVDLLRNAARVQHVPPEDIPRVVRAVYRVALDVSFRHSGGLFIVLRNRKRMRDLVRVGDAVADTRKRSLLDTEFDRALGDVIPRGVAVELAALDSAVVLSNQGQLLAYGAVLEPKRRGRTSAEEGSRTKAAIGASHYGVAVKVSSDGDITVFLNGKSFIKV